VNTSELLLAAARTGIKFWLHCDRLAYRAPAGAMTSELRDEVILHKADIIALLQARPLKQFSTAAQAPVAEGDDIPLASGQERLWLVERRMGASPLYNVHFRLVWKGTLDREMLAFSIQDVVAHHPALRTTFTAIDGVSRANISADTAIEVEYVDLRDRSPDEKTSLTDELIHEHQHLPFDLSHGPLIRAAIIALADDDHILLVTQHHIITDGWSLRIFLTELGQAYRARYLGQDVPQPDFPPTYADYVRWQQAWRTEQVHQERLAWWRDHLAGLPPLLLGQQRRVHRDTPDYSAGSREFFVPAKLASGLKDLAWEQRCTLYTVLLTAWAVLLHRCADQTDFSIGTITSGRDRAEFYGVIGFFANTVVLRCDLSGNPSAVDMITRMRIETEAVFERDVPFGDIVLAAGAAPDTSLTPLIQAAFVYQNIPVPDVISPDDVLALGADVTVDSNIDGAVAGTTKFDLSLTMKDSIDGISGYLQYATAQFGDEEIRGLGEHYVTLLQSIVRDPRETIGRLSLLSEEEQRRLVLDWSSPDFQVLEPENS
jgi:Condensation domain/TubC N-terminal docking domain